MEDANAGLPGQTGARRSEDIALDLMKFIALNSGYGKMQSGAGFSGKPAVRTNEEYAESLLQLYEKCREIVGKPRGDG